MGFWPNFWKKTMKRITAVSSFLVCSTMLTPQIGVASDYKMYAGAGCKPITGQYEYMTPSANGIWNGSSTKQKVYCPIIRDRSGSSSTTYVGVNVRRNTGVSTKLSCTVLSYKYNGNVVDSEFESFSGGRGTLWFSVKSGATYGMYCTVPKYSRIYSYYAREYQNNE